MSVIFSKSCEYATQAILFLASQKKQEPVLLRDISDALQVPHHFLNKVLQNLTRDGLVASHKGSTGGFTLGRSATRITLADIVRAVDGDSFLDACVLGFPRCGDTAPCPVHNQWIKAKHIVTDMLNTKTVAQLGKHVGTKLALIKLLKEK